MVNIQENINLAKYTTFQIGGDADYFCRPNNKNELIEALNWAKDNEKPFRLIGGGSNLLISDKGYKGLIVLNRQGEYSLEGDRVIADSGVNLSKIARETVSHGYAGLEFAQNIPGTIGGAAAGNAGAYGKDMSKTVLWAEVWKDGEIRDYLRDDFMYDYRTSRFKNELTHVILNVTCALEKGDKEKMLELANKDVDKRLRDYSGASAGSYFTNIRKDDYDIRL
jgi:UDP-N-acetylmuramate dehydrogenase